MLQFYKLGSTNYKFLSRQKLCSLLNETDHQTNIIQVVDLY